MNNKKLNKRAVAVLRANIRHINTVAEWARQVGYSRAHFSYLIKEAAGRSPYKILCREKFKKVQQLVRENPRRKGRQIANAAGFKNVKSLYKFLRHHFDTTLTEMRKTAKSGS